ncbi:MAG TPA: hypothetical protein VF720_06060 [Candidatus Eisenbacteria bacterium]
MRRQLAIAMLAVLLAGRPAPEAEASTQIGDPKPPPAPTAPDSTAAPDAHLDRPKTEAKTGGKAGALAGAVAGGGLFLLGAAYSDAETGDVDAAGYVGIGLLGAALGGIFGWALGSFLGSTVPAERPATTHHVTATPPASENAPAPTLEPPTAMPASSRHGRTLASFTLLGGYAGMADEGPVYEYPPEGGFVVHEGGTVGGSAFLGARLLRHRGEWFSYGPEVGFVTGHDGMFLLTADLLVGRRYGSTRPYAIGDIGWHNWKDGASLFGGSIGAGLEWEREPGATAFGAEYRYRAMLQNDTGEGDREFHQLALTSRFNW